ncbi:MAG: hypothetical protein C0392_08880 [Syntrophus sp. (in: bacteria)]|nr:hypothetical protein [Syntrophus sp. (in: bacteria)]
MKSIHLIEWPRSAMILEKLFSGLSEKEKYEITSWAFSYFMSNDLTVSDAVVKAVKKAMPNKVRDDNSLKIPRSTFIELQLRVKNML